eukprot:TRINITY_DN63556_c0_g1_i1.p1 TRINITY_DN63556_c0_g1~~TRINITY_DN63556_c0_g1_i1.p1  ORF type:complete len:1066 (+),score=159.89 TRINITY_DN63556_c0_g1_i1:134-3331(+)
MTGSARKHAGSPALEYAGDQSLPKVAWHPLSLGACNLVDCERCSQFLSRSSPISGPSSPSRPQSRPTTGTLSRPTTGSAALSDASRLSRETAHAVVPVRFASKLPLVKSARLSDARTPRIPSLVHRSNQAHLQADLRALEQSKILRQHTKELREAMAAHDLESLREKLGRALAITNMDSTLINAAKERVKEIENLNCLTLAEILNSCQDYLTKRKDLTKERCAAVSLLAPLDVAGDAGELQDALTKLLCEAVGCKGDSQLFVVSCDYTDQLEVTIDILSEATTILGACRTLELGLKQRKVSKALMRAGVHPDADIQILPVWPAARIIKDLKMRFPYLSQDLFETSVEQVLDAVSESHSACTKLWSHIASLMPLKAQRMCQHKSLFRYQDSLRSEGDAVGLGLQAMDEHLQEAQELSDMMADAATAQRHLKSLLAPGQAWALADYNDISLVPLDDPCRIWEAPRKHSLPNAQIMDPGIKQRADIIEKAESRRRPGMTAAPFHTLVDISRLGAVFSRVEDMTTSLIWCLHHLDILWLENKVANPCCAGFRDINLGIRSTSNGRKHVSELRLSLKPMLELQQKMGKKLHETTRAILLSWGVRGHHAITAEVQIIHCVGLTQAQAKREALEDVELAVKIVENALQLDGSDHETLAQCKSIMLTATEAAIGAGVPEERIESAIPNTVLCMKYAEQLMTAMKSGDSLNALAKAIREAEAHGVEEALIKEAQEQFNDLQEVALRRKLREAHWTHEGPVEMVAWSPDGCNVATTSDNETCRVFDVASKCERAKWEHEGLHRVVWSPDSSMVATASKDKTCRVYDLESKDEKAYWEHDGPVNFAAWSPDGRKVATASSDTTCRIFNVESTNEMAKWEHEGSVRIVTWSPDGRKLATASDDTCRVLDVHSKDETARWKNKGGICYIAWGLDNRLVAIACDNGLCRVVDVKTKTDKAKFKHEDAVNFLAWSPDGSMIATASKDATCRVFHVESKTEIAKFVHEGSLTHVTWGPGSELVATASTDRACRLFDVASRAEKSKWKHDDTVTCVEISPDGELVVTASVDRTCRVLVPDID